MCVYIVLGVCGTKYKVGSSFAGGREDVTEEVVGLRFRGRRKSNWGFRVVRGHQFGVKRLVGDLRTPVESNFTSGVYVLANRNWLRQ